MIGRRFLSSERRAEVGRPLIRLVIATRKTVSLPIDLSYQSEEHKGEEEV